MKTAQVLVIDDDDVDVMAIKRSFKKLKIANPIHVARNGLEGLEVLRGKADTAALERPYIILLDLNMPKMNGHEFLAELRADPELTDSVVFVLTTSAAEADRASAYHAHVAGYLVKGRVGEAFVEAMRLLDSYWRVVQLPT